MTRTTLRVLDQVRGAAVDQRPARPPTVTVVIPCHDYERYLPAAVGSALSQGGVAVDVVIVDDASTDGSAEAARALAAADARVAVLVNDRNRGPVETFNRGLAAATGEYLVRLDADDLLTPGSLARAAALAERYPGVGLVYGHPLHFSTPEPPRHRDRATSWTVVSGLSWLELRCELGVNCITSPEVLMRTSVVAAVGGQRALAHTHDMELWLRIARESDVGWIGGSDQAWHREHAGSLSAGLDRMADFRERARAFELLFTDGRGERERDRRMLGLARSSLADDALARVATAYARGRGGGAETDAYLEFARGLGVDLDALPHSGVAHAAQRLGPARARCSPRVVAGAAIYRATTEWRRLRWRSTGL